MGILKQLKERIECKKLAKEFERIKKLRLAKNKSNTYNQIAGEYVMYCMINGLPVANIEDTVRYTFIEGINKGKIDKYTYSLVHEENL